jgi:FAD synthase
VELEFITYLRPELKFNNVAELIEQMHRDTHKSLEVLEYER